MPVNPSSSEPAVGIEPTTAPHQSFADFFREQQERLWKGDPDTLGPRSRPESVVPVATKRQYARASRLRKFGLTADQYEAMLAAQGGGCAICRWKQTARRLAVDHCHTTGKVRGLLCTRCNCAIGNLKEDPALFARALFYLEQHKSEAVA
jgi:hypothetical protein